MRPVFFAIFLALSKLMKKANVPEADQKRFFLYSSNISF